MKLKIFNVDVVDCSTTWAYLAPNPENIDLLRLMFYKFIYSDLIAAILQIEADFYFKDESSINLYSPKAIGYFLLEEKAVDVQDYLFNTGQEARINKIHNVFIEKKDLTLKRLEGRKDRLLPSGLEGIEKIFSLIDSLINNDDSNLPESLKDKTLESFRLSTGVVWQSWINYMKKNSDDQVINYMLYKEEFIGEDVFYNEDFEYKNVYKKKDFNQLWSLWSNGNHLSINSSDLTIRFGETYDYRDLIRFEQFLKDNFGQKYYIEYEYG